MRTHRHLLLALALVPAACGDDRRPATAAAAARPPDPPALVGRWTATNTCPALVEALRANGLERYTGQMLTGQYRDEPAKVIARSADPCEGARAFRHDHEFTADGRFASYDEHGEQVDEGTYTVDGDRVTVSRPPIDVEVRVEAGPERATFTPVIPSKCRSKACRETALLNLGTFFPRDYRRADG